MINIIFNYIFGLIFQSPFWALESKSEYENNIYHLDFFYYFSCYIKVSDGQHNNISLFKIDCIYQPTDENPLLKTLSRVLF